MELYELLERVTSTLEGMKIPYVVVGSIASIAYGEPRFTNDIDIVVDLKAFQVSTFCQAFPPDEFYCPKEAASQAVKQRFQFNILHPESGFKVDVILPADSEFARSQLARGVRVLTGEHFEATFASPEDVIVKKLEYFQQGGSEKHLRDIVGIMKVQAERIDREYLLHWIARLGLESEWSLIEARLKP